jgi:lauroyl/myristoyl acyltransferase
MVECILIISRSIGINNEKVKFNKRKKMTSWIENIWIALKYFFLFPIFSLLPLPLPCLLSRYLSRLEYQYHPSRRKSIRRGMAQFLKGVPCSREGLDLATRRYFEVIFCDEMDLFIYLFGSSRRFIRGIRIEGEENLRKALKNGGGILLSAHFGGGFWILPFLKERGIKAHFFSGDIKKEDYASRMALYYYRRLRGWAVERASGGRVLFKQDGKKNLIKVLEKGGWVIILFDVPPFLVRENMEVSFLKKRAFFPKGIISIAKETNSPILPFFSFLDEGRQRRISFEEPIHVIDEEECVKRCVKLIENRIIERPDHWHFWPIADQFFVPG